MWQEIAEEKKKKCCRCCRSAANTVEVRQLAHAQTVFWLTKNVDALIYIYSLTIHSFVPFQQFVSDNQKLDYQCDMSGICQRQISGWSWSCNRTPEINPLCWSSFLRAPKWAKYCIVLIIICKSKILLLASLEGVKYWWWGLLCDDLSRSLPSTRIIRLVHCVLCLFAREPPSAGWRWHTGAKLQRSR